MTPAATIRRLCRRPGVTILPALLRLAFAVTLVGCNFTPPTPVARVRRGPAAAEFTSPLAALPVSCEGTSMGCLPGYLYGVASATRIALEYGGYTVVDGELINAELRRRTTRTTDEVTQTEVTGAVWSDLPVLQQRELLSAMGVRGVLRAQVALGTPHGMAAQRTVTVGISLARLEDDLLVWQSQCDVETGDFHSEAQAVDLATRCSLESATLW